MLPFSRSNLSRSPSASATQLFATSVRCSRTGVNCSHPCHPCICSRKQVQQCHYTYWRGARFSHHPLGIEGWAAVYSLRACIQKKVAQGIFTALDADSYVCLKVLLQQWALGGADIAGFQQHPSTFCFIYFFSLYSPDRAVAVVFVAKWSFEQVN